MRRHFASHVFMFSRFTLCNIRDAQARRREDQNDPPAPPSPPEDEELSEPPEEPLSKLPPAPPSEKLVSPLESLKEPLLPPPESIGGGAPYDVPLLPC